MALVSPREAERVAALLLGWLAEEPGRLGGFLSAAGAAPGDLRAAAADPAFLGFVLDHVLADESLLMEACEGAGLAPETPARARAALPGGDAPHWT